MSTRVPRFLPAKGVASVALAAIFVFLVPPSSAWSAAFFLQEQSPIASGRAFAGDAAAAEDPSTIFYNPAGMTELHGGLQGETGLYVISPHADLSNRQTSVVAGASPAVPAGGLSQDQPFNPQLSGNLYLAAPIDPRFWVGFGVTVPFGLKDQYQPDYFGRYDSVKTALQTIDLAPSAAYALAPWLSVGGGVDVQYADAEFESALPNPFVLSSSTDGVFDASGSDWAVGFNGGLLLKPVEHLRLGLSYRSGMNHDLKGNASSSIPGITSSSQSVTASFKLPDIASLGVAYDVTSTITLLGQADYYGWRRFKNINLTFADGTQQVIPQNYHNTVGFSFGGEWKVAPAWTLRSGIEFDPTPTPNDGRSTGVPDSDRTWLAFGVSYDFNERLGIDVSYAHDFAASASINRTDSFPALATTANVGGMTTDTSNVVGLAIHFRY